MKLYSKGEQIRLPADRDLRIQIEYFLAPLEKGIFDIDGVLLEGGLETPNNPVTVDEYLQEKKREVADFKSITSEYPQYGFTFGICTGRSFSFAVALVEKLFAPGVCTELICESGAVKGVHNSQTNTWDVQIPAYLNYQNVETFQQYADLITEICVNRLGGALEPGKSMILSFNPRLGVLTEDFFAEVCSQKEIIQIKDALSIAFSDTAVDIGPAGSSKLLCLQEITGKSADGTGGQMIFYVGDANNDIEAMAISNVNMVPGNGSKDVMDQAKQARLGLISELPDIAGTCEMLHSLLKLKLRN